MDLTRFLKQSHIANYIVYLSVRKLHTSKPLPTKLEYSANAKLSKPLFDRYLCLPLPECKSIVEYIWISGYPCQVLSKARTLTYEPTSFKEVPNWKCNGELIGLKEDPTLVPVALYKDPIRRGKNKLVLCEVYDSDNNPAKTNHRNKCVEALNGACKQEPCFGFEQGMVFMDVDDRPFGWPVMLGEPVRSNTYYCSLGGRRVHGRDIMEAFYRSCLYSGVELYGINADVWPAKWVFKTGPTEGIKASDDLWMARYFIARIAEEYGLEVTFKPRPCPNWSGLACHVNFSTKKMRDPKGIKTIEQATKQLEKTHKDFLTLCDATGGEENKKRLDGKDGTSQHGKYITSDKRCCSVRVPADVKTKGKGYLQDRRPGGNADPYNVVNALVRITCLGEENPFCNQEKGGKGKN